MFDENILDSKVNILEFIKSNNSSDKLFSSNNYCEKNVIFIGDKASGKTTIFNSLFNTSKEKFNTTSNSNNENLQYNQTCGINYNYYKGSIKEINKKVIINGYEIGGGISNANLLSTILNKQISIKNSNNNNDNNNDNLTDTILEIDILNKLLIVLVFDLSQPYNFINSLKSFTKSISNTLLDSFKKETLLEFTNNKKSKLNILDNNKEAYSIFPANIIMICNKFDKFEKYDM